MFRTQHILHVDGSGDDHMKHNLSFMLMEMVVMMFPDMFINTIYKFMLMEMVVMMFTTMFINTM